MSPTAKRAAHVLGPVPTPPPPSRTPPGCPPTPPPQTPQKLLNAVGDLFSNRCPPVVRPGTVLQRNATPSTTPNPHTVIPHPQSHPTQHNAMLSYARPYPPTRFDRVPPPPPPPRTTVPRPRRPIQLGLLPPKGPWAHSHRGVRGATGLCLKGRGALRAVPERLQSGHRECKCGCGGGWRLLAVGNAVGAGVGVGNAFWGGVRAGVLGGGEGVTPPLFKRFPGRPLTSHISFCAFVPPASCAHVQ